jgi:hypothetical protein
MAGSFDDYQVLYSDGPPASPIRLGQLLVDESESDPADMLKICTSLSPVTYTSIPAGGGAVPVGANPTATIGLSVINGSAATFMRSDAAPPLSQAIVPTWSGLHTFDAGAVIAQSTQLRINGAAGTATRRIDFESAGVDRFRVRIDEAAESGSNAGSNFRIEARADDGSAIYTPVIINRALPEMTLALHATINLVSLNNVQAAFDTTLTRPVIYSTAASGSAPFNEAGHLILQSRPSGAVRDIILVTGTTPAIRLRIANGRVASTVPIALQGYTVAGLPAGAVGDTAYVTDANATTFASTVAGGGANIVPVFYNGTNWIIG